jgi:20S proteasome alpha/beta subunit
VTVCIATYCLGPKGEPMVIGACDRMLTGEFMEFEPRFSKIHNLTPNIVALIAGDTAAQSSICVGAHEAKPRSVGEAAEIFSAELAKHNRKQAERKILAPLGFTMRTFFEKQAHLSPEFVDDILRQIRSERADVHTIVCGTDGKGAHIYTIDDFGRLSYSNSVGFSAVGVGAWHAQSQLMFAKYDPAWSFTHALLVTYIAKRRAEVTPGVGVDTDLFFIAPSGGFCFFQPDMVAGLEDIYREITEEQNSALGKARSRIDKFCEELVASAAQVQAETTPPPAPELDTPQPPPRKARKRSG